MNNTTPTGPSPLGRWQQPAALANAGVVPPDPYPLEKILFCATTLTLSVGTFEFQRRIVSALPTSCASLRSRPATTRGCRSANTSRPMNRPDGHSRG